MAKTFEFNLKYGYKKLDEYIRACLDTEDLLSAVRRVNKAAELARTDDTARCVLYGKAAKLYALAGEGELSSEYLMRYVNLGGNETIARLTDLYNLFEATGSVNWKDYAHLTPELLGIAETLDSDGLNGEIIARLREVAENPEVFAEYTPPVDSIKLQYLLHRAEGGDNHERLRVLEELAESENVSDRARATFYVAQALFFFSQKDFGEAEAKVRDALACSSGNFPAMMQMYRLGELKGEPALSAEAVELMIGQVSEECEDNLSSIRFLLHLGRVDAALDKLKLMMRLNPNIWEYFVLYATVQYNFGEFAQAKRIFLEVKDTFGIAGGAAYYLDFLGGALPELDEEARRERRERAEVFYASGAYGCYTDFDNIVQSDKLRGALNKYDASPDKDTARRILTQNEMLDTLPINATLYFRYADALEKALRKQKWTAADYTDETERALGWFLAMDIDCPHCYAALEAMAASGDPYLVARLKELAGTYVAPSFPLISPENQEYVCFLIFEYRLISALHILRREYQKTVAIDYPRRYDAYSEAERDAFCAAAARTLVYDPKCFECVDGASDDLFEVMRYRGMTVKEESVLANIVIYLAQYTSDSFEAELLNMDEREEKLFDKIVRVLEIDDAPTNWTDCRKRWRETVVEAKAAALKLRVLTHRKTEKKKKW